MMPSATLLAGSCQGTMPVSAPAAPRRGLLAKILGVKHQHSSRTTFRAAAASCATAARGGDLAGFAAADPQFQPSSSSPGLGPSTHREGELQYSVSVGLPPASSAASKYQTIKELGRGGNGVVRLVKDTDMGTTYACKAIPKVLGEGFSDVKRKGHLDALKREIGVMQQLKGCLDVVNLIDAYEDEDNAYLVMEYCSGGELWHAIGDRHYSERTVASYMRGVLRTLAVMHSHHILHRDIKPGNFMLLSGDDRSPLKAIDFGLAVPFDPNQLPRTDLGLEGTPWYMAPETLSSRVTPAADVWAAGVMAYQLLTGRFPFDDFKNTNNPSISAIWKSVLCDNLQLNKPWCNGISEEAKDFIRMLLDKDPERRPSAREALKHPWLQGGRSDRSQGKKLARSVVQRLQRFGQRSKFKRGVLQLIAHELLEASHATSTASLASLASLASMDSDSFEATSSGGAGEGEGASAPGSLTTDVRALQRLYRQLRLEGPSAAVDHVRLHKALKDAGFRLELSEVERLLDNVDVSGSGRLDKEAFVCAMIDWRQLQQGNTDLWLSLVKRTFESIDTDGDGVLRVDEIIGALRDKLPEHDLHDAVLQALREADAGGPTGGFGADGDSDLGATDTDEPVAAAEAAPSADASGAPDNTNGRRVQHWLESSQQPRPSSAAVAGAQPAVATAPPKFQPPSGFGTRPRGIDFQDFVRMLKAGSVDSLDLYDDRFGQPSPSVHAPTLASQGSLDKLNQMLQKSPSVNSVSGSLAAAAASDGSSKHGSYFFVRGQRVNGSVHNGSTHNGSLHSRRGANDSTHNGSSAMAFRFDVAGPGSGAPPPAQPAPAPQQPSAAPAEQAKPEEAAAASSFFRFDLAKDFKQPQPAPLAADAMRITAWRFDAPRPGSAAPPPPSPAPALQPPPEQPVGAGACAALSLPKTERTHHGSMLYASAMAGGVLGRAGALRQLETVQE